MFQRVITEVLESFDLQPLQYLATMRVAISICEADDMQDMLRTFRKPRDQGRAVAFSNHQWKRLSNKGRKKLVQIGVPDLIIDIILEKLWAVSFEIFKWITHHAEDTGIDFSSTYCWTPRFTIDSVKTAEMLAKNETLDIKKRFKLACFYCLESEVRSLWRMMSLAEKRFFFVRGNLKKSNHDPIVLYWTYYIQEAPTEYWASKTLNHTELYEYSVTNGYLSATNFFLPRLKEEFRDRMISNSLLSHRHIHKPEGVVKDRLAIACFLICQLSYSIPRATIDFYEVSLVFRHFLEWPWQKHFMTVVNRLRDYILEGTFGELLEAIFEKEMEGFRDYDYKELFKEFWRQGPEKCKAYVNVDSRVGLWILLEFVKKHFGFVFKEHSFTLKRKFRNIVFQQNVSENVPCSEQENVEFFKFLVLNQVGTKSSMQRFSQRRFNYDFREFRKYFNLPLGELTFLMDGLLETV